jgi:hypothetical protein
VKENSIAKFYIEVLGIAKDSGDATSLLHWYQFCSVACQEILIGSFFVQESTGCSKRGWTF